MQKLIFLLLIFCSTGLCLSAQNDALDDKISRIVNDLVAKMNTKTTIKNVAIADFANLNGTPTELGKYLAEQFSDVMVNANISFSVVNRGRLNFLLKEAGLDAKGLLDPNSVAKLGKLKGIDAIVVGTMTSVGENINVNVQALNLETAVILASAKGSLPRTPAIIELEKKELGIDLGGGTTPIKTVSTTPKMPAQSTFEQDPIRFECLECKQSGENIRCKIRITSIERDAALSICNGYGGEMSKIIDDEGNDFILASARLANVSGDEPRKTLVADVPITAEFTFSAVNRNVSSVTKMEIWARATDWSYFTIFLKNIPITKN